MMDRSPTRPASQIPRYREQTASRLAALQAKRELREAPADDRSPPGSPRPAAALTGGGILGHQQPWTSAPPAEDEERPTTYAHPLVEDQEDMDAGLTSPYMLRKLPPAFARDGLLSPSLQDAGWNRSQSALPLPAFSLAPPSTVANGGAVGRPSLALSGGIAVSDRGAASPSARADEHELALLRAENARLRALAQPGPTQAVDRLRSELEEQRAVQQQLLQELPRGPVGPAQDAAWSRHELEQQRALQQHHAMQQLEEQRALQQQQIEHQRTLQHMQQKLEIQQLQAQLNQMAQLMHQGVPMAGQGSLLSSAGIVPLSTPKLGEYVLKEMTCAFNSGRTPATSIPFSTSDVWTALSTNPRQELLFDKDAFEVTTDERPWHHPCIVTAGLIAHIRVFSYGPDGITMDAIRLTHDALAVSNSAAPALLADADRMEQQQICVGPDKTLQLQSGSLSGAKKLPTTPIVDGADLARRMDTLIFKLVQLYPECLRTRTTLAYGLKLVLQLLTKTIHTHGPGSQAWAQFITGHIDEAVSRFVSELRHELLSGPAPSQLSGEALATVLQGRTALVKDCFISVASLLAGNPLLSGQINAPRSCFTSGYGMSLPSADTPLAPAGVVKPDPKGVKPPVAYVALVHKMKAVDGRVACARHHYNERCPDGATCQYSHAALTDNDALLLARKFPDLLRSQGQG